MLELLPKCLALLKFQELHTEIICPSPQIEIIWNAYGMCIATLSASCTPATFIERKKCNIGKRERISYRNSFSF